jgi:hypothetical protein
MRGMSASDYVGVGYVGHSDADDSQRRVSPSLSHGSQSHSRYSSSNAYHEEEEEDLQQRQVVPNDLHGIQSSAYRSSANHEEEEDTQKLVGYHDASVSNDGSQSFSRRTQQQREQYESENSRSTPKVYYVSAPQSSSSSHSQRAGSESEYQETRSTPQRVSLQVRPGSTTVLQVPVRVLNTVGVPESSQQYNSRSSSSAHQQSVQQQVSPTQRVTYYVAPVSSSSDRYDASSRSGSESSRTSYVQQQPEKYVAPDLTAYNSFSSQSRSQLDDESDVQTRVRPYTPSIVDGGSSRYASSSSSQSENSQRTQTRVVPALPVQSESLSASHRRIADEQRERQYSSSRPSYINRTPITAEESRRTEGSSSYGSSGTTVYRPAPTTSQQSSSHHSANSQSQSRSNFAGNSYSPYSPSYTPSRYNSATVNSNTDNLHEYMSESQRLAEAQQRQIAPPSSLPQHQASSSSYSSASEANRRTLDLAQRLDSAAANFVHSQNLANRQSEFDTEDLGSTGNGGYQRVKSWQKQSKWESG